MAPGDETPSPIDAGQLEPEVKPASEAEEATAVQAPEATPVNGRIAEDDRVGAAVAAEAPAPGARTLYGVLWSTGLLTVGAIARRELGSLFVSPIAYVVGVVVILGTSWFGYLNQISASTPVSMAGVFGWVALLMVFFTPLYTMRLLAEERRSGTLEILMTSPVRDWELVVGKWLAGFAFYLATIAFTLVYVVLISLYQQQRATVTILGAHVSLPNVDYGAIFTGYVGVVLVAAAWVALGLLASSLTTNQIIAAVVGIAVLLALQFAFAVASQLLAPPWSDLLDYASASNRLQSFNQGQLALRDVVYFLTLTIGALFVTARIVESRKWR